MMDFRFKDLLHTSYDERMREEKVNLFTGEDVFRVPETVVSVGCVIWRVTNCVVDSRKVIEVDNRIDPRSKQILNTFNEMLNKVFRPEMSVSVSTLDYAKEEKDKDFSALISYLSRILEIELNNSIVQWVRFVHEIEMPRYYNQVQPGKICKLILGPNHLIIDLNQAQCSELKAQPLGIIQQLLRKYKSILPEELRPFSDGLVKLLAYLRKYRNKSSHTSVLNENDFIDFYDRFCEFLQKGWLAKLMDIKCSLSKR